MEPSEVIVKKIEAALTIAEKYYAMSWNQAAHLEAFDEAYQAISASVRKGSEPYAARIG